MPSAVYSFIDVAALDPVRAHFVAGDAVAVLSADLDAVIWANGPGAALFGFAEIEAILGRDAGLTSAQRRQISATPGFPRIGADRPVILRLNAGFGSRALVIKASELKLPDGETAILLCAPSSGPSARDASEMARRAISGFGGADHFAALLKADGTVAAATDGFESLGISPETLAELAPAGARDRVIKRLVPANGARLPMGMARIADDPAHFFVLVVAEDRFEAAPPAVEALKAEPDPASANDVDASADPGVMPVTDDVEPQAKLPEAPVPPVTAGRDDWYFADAKAAPEPAPRQRPDRGPASAAARSGTIRFVWRTDAQGRFSALSEEFVEAVGGRMDDLIGRSFRDVARDLDFDGDGEIAALLERRDTWSGRSVLWPLAGLDKRAPVDLAALPTYSRDRTFEGFRGFGVARMSDLVDAPAPIATTSPQPEAAQEAPDPSPEDPFSGELPALVVLPTPQRRSTDKVIRLAEHRPAGDGKGLSPVERNAFREIGDRLKEFAGPQASNGDVAEAREEAERIVATAPDEAELAPIVEAQQAADAAVDDSDEAEDAAPHEDNHEKQAAWTDIGGEELTLAVSDDAFETQERAPNLVRRDRPAETPHERVDDDKGISADDDDGDVVGIDDGLAILARLPLPLLVHSGDTLHFANREFLSLTGYETLDDLAGAGGLDALIAGPYPREGNGEPARRKLRIIRASGEEFAAEGHLQSVPWDGGKALLLALRTVELIDEEEPEPDARDYDLLLRKAEAMRDRVIEMQTIVDTATDGLVLLSNDGMIRSISRPAEALFGYNDDEVRGKPFTSLFAVESHRGVMEYLAGLADNGVASILNDGREVIGRESQGRFIPLFMTIGRLPDKSGFCAVLRDVTQWKRAEEELTQARAQAERASSQKSDFLARISHEIRTPLNAIIGFSELMMAEKFGPIGNERYRDYLRDINRSGSHVLDLVNDLLDISKIEAGEQEMAHEAVSLNDTLAETVAMMQPQANRERVIIRSSFAQRLPEIVADQRSVRQIALNLLSNAVRYTPAGGQVIVSTAHEASGEVVMRVRDTGIGMTHSEIEQALKPFKQINALKRPRGDGTGLGLPLTKAMVEANRAKFLIHSTPGEGTMVEITFPSTRVLAG